MNCFFCHKEVEIGDLIGRQEACPYCGGDLHICKNCRHYDVTAYNECRETQAERVLDKESSNFCDYFSCRGNRPVARTEDPAVEARKKLEELFKKN